ncbi:MAG: prepilin peptidase [Lachnospiraceae bacterium]|nr:prepilin peptidase [Lachnospiraceae bacterium]
MITEIFLGIFLFICSITDLKEREIKPIVLIFFGTAATVLYILFRPVGLYEEAAGIVIGLFFVALYFITDEKIGLGDGLLMIVTGIFLGGRQNASLIMIAMLLSAVYSIVFLVIKKADKKTSFAFVPFVFAAFLIRLMIGRF